jgi:hypothetical protein
VTQHALGGHAIPVNQGLLTALVAVGVVSGVEAARGVVPGLERAISKAKGFEAASMLHQLGVEVGKNPYGQVTRKILLEIDPNCKDRLPKRPAKPDEGDSADAPGGDETPVTEVRPEPKSIKTAAKMTDRKAPKTPATDREKVEKSADKNGDTIPAPPKKKLSAKKKTKAKKTETDKLAKRKPR